MARLCPLTDATEELERKRAESNARAVDPKAVALVEALHAGDLAGFLKSAAADPKLLNARGPEGSTPFMYAVLYTGPSGPWNAS